jgi:hypothetical protein
MFNGYKTYLGAVLIGVGAALKALGYSEVAEVLMRLGEALGVAGIGHKLAKASRGGADAKRKP